MSDTPPVDPFDAEVAALIDHESLPEIDVSNRIMLPFSGMFVLPEGITLDEARDYMKRLANEISQLEGYGDGAGVEVLMVGSPELLGLDAEDDSE